MKRAIYAFSGDPITFGHIDIIERALRVFDELVVAIGSNPEKEYTFALEERLQMARKSLEKYENVKVISFTGTLVDYAYENGINAIIKGIRNADDFDYEVMLHQIGESQKLSVDTFFLPAKQDKTHISSSAVKALQKENGLVHEYVPLYVKQCLEDKISEQFIIGITGEIGTGKTFVAEQLKNIFVKTGPRHVPTHIIELDLLGHQVIGQLTDPLYEEVRKKLIETFGREIELNDGFIDRKKLGNIVFEDREALETLNQIMQPAMMVRLRRELHDKKGIILFVAAILAEARISYISNNNVILVSSEFETQVERIKSRDLNEEHIKRRIESQFSTEEKVTYLQSEIEKNNQGKLWRIENDTDNITNKLNLLATDIIKYFEIK